MQKPNTSYAIIGSGGQLGHELVRQGKNSGINLLSLDLPDFDITDPTAIAKWLQPEDVSLVINAAGYTNVDGAEQEPEQAFAINRDGPAYLASRCHEIGVPLVHISTDYVFDGKKTDAYLETDPVSPLGVYGKSKAEGESEILKCLNERIIIRTAWLYGINGHNFVKTILEQARKKEIIGVVDDQKGCPTHAVDLAGVIFTLAELLTKGEGIQWGTYNYCGEGVTSWYGFAEAIFSIAKKYESFAVREVVPITTGEYPTPALRPANSVLDCSKIRRVFGIQTRPWRDSLAEMIQTLLFRQDLQD